MKIVLPSLPDLWQELWGLLSQVPAGRVTTYGALAHALGDFQATRWAGHVMLHHEHQADCLCHRVIRVTGELGGYIAGGTAEKARRLLAEGAPVVDDKVDLQAAGVTEFVTARPLVALGEAQQSLVDRLSLVPPPEPPRTIGGVDVAYLDEPHEGPGGRGVGVAAYARVDAATGSLLWSCVIRRTVRFPYISGYLGYRELPLLLDLLAEVRAAEQLADVLLVDGSGILHARHAGVATHLGIVADVPTIGVSKKHLAGKLTPEQANVLPPPLETASTHGRNARAVPVVNEDRVAGAALYSSPRSQRPIFVSPGHRVDLAYALHTVRQALHGRRLPEPQYWADRLSKEGKRSADE